MCQCCTKPVFDVGLKLQGVANGDLLPGRRSPWSLSAFPESRSHGTRLSDAQTSGWADCGYRTDQSGVFIPRSAADAEYALLPGP